jgi:hypothetical protein
MVLSDMLSRRSRTLVMGLLISGGLFAQCLDSLGLDDDPAITSCEAQVLSSLRGSWPYAVGTQPVIAFRYGNYAKSVDKSYFFQKLIVPWLQRDSRPSVSWHVLSLEERERTGVDAIVVAWSKVGLTERGKRRVLRRLEAAARKTSPTS